MKFLMVPVLEQWATYGTLPGIILIIWQSNGIEVYALVCKILNLIIRITQNASQIVAGHMYDEFFMSHPWFIIVATGGSGVQVEVLSGHAIES